MADKAVAYPEKLELEKMSPELLMVWAKRTTLQMEIEAFSEGIANADKKEDDDESKITPEKRQQMEEYLEQLRKQLDQFTSMHEELKTMIVKKNPFAEEMTSKKRAHSQNDKKVKEKPAQVQSDVDDAVQIEL